jgi:hypothetical protein
LISVDLPGMGRRRWPPDRPLGEIFDSMIVVIELFKLIDEPGISARNR